MIYVLSGAVSHGRGKGRGAGFPTANLEPVPKDLPEHGVYASLFYLADGRLFTGVTNVGLRPTADDDPRPTVETFLDGFDGDLYGLEAAVVLLERLRPDRRFDDMEALGRQIESDRRTAARITGEYLAQSVLTKSREETAALGRRLAERLAPGSVVTLNGPMGAGKSELARGIARGLGVTGPLPSPTFTILNAYDAGRLPLYHYDWYRIEDEEELTVIGAEDHLPGDGVTLVEWAELAPGLLPRTRLDVTLTPVFEGVRLIHLKPLGDFPDTSTWIKPETDRC